MASGGAAPCPRHHPPVAGLPPAAVKPALGTQLALIGGLDQNDVPGPGKGAVGVGRITKRH